MLCGEDIEPVRARSLAQALSEVPDPRDAKGRLYRLGPTLAMAVCAMLCGARSLYAIAQWGKDHGPKMAHTLGFGRPRTPCVSTLHYLFLRLDTDALERVLSRWMIEQGLEAGEAAAIDGKTLRGIHGDDVPGVHLVALYAHGAGRVLFQRGTGKDAELTVATSLLEGVALKDLVVTGDALYAQKALCDKIVRCGGDYLFCVKDNQPTLLFNIALLFSDPSRHSASHTETDGHGGRSETRILEASSEINDYLKTWGWDSVRQVARVTRSVTRKGKATTETAYLITSLKKEKADPKRLLALNRGHWKIENRLHWVRDVTMGEDASQVRTGSLPQVMAALRNTATSLLRQKKETNVAAALRRNAAFPKHALKLLGLTL